MHSASLVILFAIELKISEPSRGRTVCWHFLAFFFWWSWGYVTETCKQAVKIQLTAFMYWM